MKGTMRTLVGLVLITMLVLTVSTGCEKKEPAKPSVPKPPTPDVTPKAMTGGAAAAAPTASGSGTATTKPVAITTQPTTNPAKTNVSVADDKSAQKIKDANDLLAKAMQAMKDTKLEDARAALDKADAMKDSLPEGLRKELTTARTSLDKIEKAKNALPSVTVDPDNK